MQQQTRLWPTVSLACRCAADLQQPTHRSALRIHKKGDLQAACRAGQKSGLGPLRSGITQETKPWHSPAALTVPRLKCRLFVK